jgi:hypothetical protein
MKIFISSPQVSLANYRKAIKESLEKMSFDDIFLSEYHNSRSRSPMEVCMENVKDCDIFILLLGNKYGTILEDSAISVTEMEFDKAKELKKDIIVFKLKGEVEEIEPRQNEFIRKISGFKDGLFWGKEIESEVELEKRVGQDIIKHLESKLKDANKYKKALTSGTESELKFRGHKTVELPANGVKDVLFLKSRINYSHEAGAAYLMKIMVNDKPITARYLLNKSLIFKIKDGRESPWFNSENKCWMVFYSSNFKDNYFHERYKVINGDPYIFAFDLSDFRKLNEKYKITIEHAGTDDDPSFRNSLIIDDLKVL